MRTKEERFGLEEGERTKEERASVTTFTRGGHGYAEEEGLSSMASPHHAGYDDGAQLHHMDSAQQPDMSGAPGIRHQAPSEAMNPQLLMAQSALRGNIEEGMAVAKETEDNLYSAASLPPLGSDSASVKWKQTTLDVSKQNVSSALAAMLAATAQIITLTGGEPTDTNYTALGSAITTISTNLNELAKAVRLLAALDVEGMTPDDLLRAARALANATAGLLNASSPEHLENRTQLLAAAGEMGAHGGYLLSLAGDSEVDPKIQEALVAMAKGVASATAALVTNARNVAAHCEDQGLQNQVIMAAKQTALATQALIACTKVLAPCIDSPLCQEQLIDACKLVAAAVEKIVIAAQAACGDDDALRDLGAAATAVTEALNNLIHGIKEDIRNAEGDKYDDAVEAILAATERLFSSMGNAQEMVRQAKLLAEATASLINAIKREAEAETDPDARKKLLDAARALADATAFMVEAAKVAARNPHDEQAQENLRRAAEQLRAVTNAAASNAIKKKAIKKLEVAAKQAAAVSTQCIAAAQGAAASNRNEASQAQLINHCKAVAEQISSLVQRVRTSMSNPDSPSAQLGLINSSQAMIPPAGKMVAAAKAAVPTVGDQAAALQLGNFAKATASALAELRAASTKAADVCGSLEIDSAIDTVKGLSMELAEAKREAHQGKLVPLPGESVESCALELGATSKTVGSSMAQLLTAANQGNDNYTGIAARDTANALRVLAGAVRGVAAGTKNPRTQEYILTTAQTVMDQSVALIQEAKMAVEDPTAPNKQMRLAQAAKAVSQALNQVVNCLPGQIEFDQAIKAIAQASLALQRQQFPSAGEASYQTLQSNLSSCAAALNVAGSEVMTAAKSTPEHQAEASSKFSKTFSEMLTAGLTLAGASKDPESRNAMLGYLRTISVSSTKLLLAAKALSADPNAPNVMNQLAAACRAVTDAINSLLDLCSTSGPGQKECDNALRNIEAVAPVLANPNEPVSDLSYFDCLDVVMEKSRTLGQDAATITTSAKNSSYDEFSRSVESASQAVCQLTEAAAQAAYLVGIADPSSTAATPGLVDQAQFARANQAVSTACQNLLNPASNQQQVLAAATVIAKHTSVLCNACKVASSKTSNPVAKRHFVQAAKEVANSTANLVKNIKALAGDLSDRNREACAETTKPLQEAVEALTTFASSPQFASTPAKISAQARTAQQPILEAGNNVIKSSSSLLTSAKNLAMNPRDPPTWQLLTSHSKALADAMKNLLMAIREGCPGQKECDQALTN
ncbi:Talin-1 [Geodia barretti]|uniref:Talin-1 n=1 Tax=Geodia barretti TaxID=519541 RepID=A0AA35WUK6_GEOBA|nr:Talin-1 [Geodia barretti]